MAMTLDNVPSINGSEDVRMDNGAGPDGEPPEPLRSRSRSVSPRRHSSSRYHRRPRSPSVSRSRSRSRGRSRTPTPDRRRRRRYSRSYSRSRSRSRTPRRSRYSPRRPRGGPRNQTPPAPSKVLGVFGLHLRTRERDLQDLFSTYGPLNKVTIVYDHRSDRSRGFGFVYFENLADATRAREDTNGLELDNRKIRVDYSTTQRPHTPTPGQYMGDKRRRGGRSDRPYGRRRSRSRSYSPVRRRRSRSRSRGRRSRSWSRGRSYSR